MQEVEEWQFLSKEGQIIKFNQKLEEFVGILAEKNIDEPMPVALNANTLIIIKQFIEAHNYDKTTIKIQKPIISGRAQDNIDQASFQILELKQNQELFDSVLQASYYLDFPILKQACLVMRKETQRKLEQNMVWGIYLLKKNCRFCRVIRVFLKNCKEM